MKFLTKHLTSLGEYFDRRFNWIFNKMAKYEKYFMALMKYMGVFLFMALHGLFVFFFYMVLYDLFYMYHQAYRNYYLTTGLIIIGLSIYFNVLFNYYMCVFRGAGLTQSFRSLQIKNVDLLLQQLHQKYLGEYINLDRNALKNLPDLKKKDYWDKYYQLQLKTGYICQRCQAYKPLRAHHCSICNKCVLKMDHHCPWIAGCVGQFNHRYFLLFLLWIWIGMLVYSLLIIPVFFFSTFTDVYYRNEDMFELCSFLGPILLFIIGVFGGMSWWQALNGETTIERKGKKRNDGKNYDFSDSDYRINLFIVFGTKNIFKAILPSIRRIPLHFKYTSDPDDDPADDDQSDDPDDDEEEACQLINGDQQWRNDEGSKIKKRLENL